MLCNYRNHNRTPGHFSQKNENPRSHKKTYTQMFIAVLFIIVKNWKQPCPHWWVVKPTRAGHARGDCPNIENQRLVSARGTSRRANRKRLHPMWCHLWDVLAETELKIWSTDELLLAWGRRVGKEWVRCQGIWGMPVAMEVSYMGSMLHREKGTRDLSVI